MKIIETRPRHREQCKNCNSIYDLEPGDMFVTYPKPEYGLSMAHDYVMLWNCPVCSRPNVTPSTHFPLEWLPIVKATSGTL